VSHQCRFARTTPACNTYRQHIQCVFLQIKECAEKYEGREKALLLQSTKKLNMSELYPLKFKAILKERIWGGDKLGKVLNKSVKKKGIGESWELSCVDGDISVISNGYLKNNSLQEAIEIYMDELVGEKVFSEFGTDFPLLIKFIDAADDLSIQVHPDDKLAAERHKSFGKTEMWYVMDANPGAQLISGFNKKMTKNEYAEHVNNKSLRSILNFHTVQKGDTFFIPAGRVHAIGAGLLIAEIQQTSDITYRIYDWDRIDASGKPRELHTDLALDAIDYAFTDDVKLSPAKTSNTPVQLASCKYFTTNRIVVDKPLERDYITIDSFIIYICCEGVFEIVYDDNQKTEVKKGETVLIPAILKDIQLNPKPGAEILEVYIS
jgi:mannose-6-phosphate isomerase